METRAKRHAFGSVVGTSCQLVRRQAFDKLAACRYMLAAAIKIFHEGKASFR
jgi:hypothetical protein